MSAGAAGFLGGLAKGYERGVEMRKKREKEAAEAEAGTVSAPETASGDWYNDPSSHTRGGPQRRSMSAPAKLTVADPEATDLPPEARAFLNGTSHGESGGAYNVRYSPQGAQTFDLAGGHPRIFEDGPHGKSSAAGRYQFTATTWDEYGGDDFGGKAQDHAAWALAQDRYRATTGGDLLTDLREGGMSDGIMDALSPTWAAFGNKDKRGSYASTYADSLARYSTPATPERRSMPAPAPKTWGWANEITSNLGSAT